MNITEQIKIIKRNRLFPGELFISNLFEQFVITNTNEYKIFTINDNTIMSFYLGRLFFSDAIIKYLKHSYSFEVNTIMLSFCTQPS
jgi:hypothetical protein